MAGLPKSVESELRRLNLLRQIVASDVLVPRVSRNAVARSLTNPVDGAPKVDGRRAAGIRRSIAALAAMPTDRKLAEALDILRDNESGAGWGTGAIHPLD